VDWKLPAHLIDRQIRGCTPEPGAWTEFDGERMKLWPVTLPRDGATPGLAPGDLHIEGGTVYAGTGSRPVRLGDVQPPGKRRMPAADWARGLRGDQAARPGFG
jgi:methionyl-tRNA formyltransferase